MTIQEYNNLILEDKVQALFKCCGSTKWAKALANNGTFESVSHLLQVSDSIWNTCDEDDYLEAFSHHPKIGDVKSLEKKFAATKEWAAGEQAAVSTATHAVIKNLAKENEVYEKKFGFIFIVCATGKSAEEMLNLLTLRLPNTAESELKIAAAEQNKITHIRINKLMQ